MSIHPHDPQAPLLEVDEVGKTYTMGGLLGRRRVRAVERVSFTLPASPPRIVAIVGESGSGKSTLAGMVLGGVAPDTGAIRFRGQPLAELQRGTARHRFMAAVQPIFQNPFEAFNPLKRVDRYLFATARNFTSAASQAEAQGWVDRALRQVGLSLAEVQGRFPHELSGGQLQRTAIARALIPGPALLVADEPVSMVDASLRMSIVNLFQTLRDELGLSILYITHDLATAWTISDEVLIMHRGLVVEAGPARDVLAAPRHPYAVLLKASLLSIEAAGRGRLTASAQPSDRPAVELADACRFAARCPKVMPECLRAVPPLFEQADGRRRVRCILFHPDAQQAGVPRIATRHREAVAV